MSVNYPVERLVAHRGASSDLPENSLAAVQAALAAGARAVEVDIQVSLEGVPFVFHDPVLMRTTGRRGAVMQLPAAELDRISAHDPARFAETFLPTPIPRLAALRDLLDEHPDCHAFIEIKRHALRHLGVDETIRRVTAVLQGARFEWTLISFDDRVAAAAVGKASCGWVLPAWDDQIRERAGQLRPDFLFVKAARVGADALWPGDWRWVIYEIGDWPGVRHWLERGASLVETDSILRLLAQAR